MADTNTNGQHSQQPANSTSTDEQPTRDADDSEIMVNAELLTTATELGTDTLDHFTPEEDR